MGLIFDHLRRSASLNRLLTCVILALHASFALAKPKPTDHPLKFVQEPRNFCSASCYAKDPESHGAFLGPSTDEGNKYFEPVESPHCSSNLECPDPLPSLVGGNKSCPCFEDEHGYKCNCTCRNLTSVPGDLPVNLTRLDLSCNKIVSIPARNFSRYPNLICLNLELNTLRTLNNDSFMGLSNLECLNLWSNELVMNSTNYPPGVFRDLKTLRTLKIHRNNNNFHNYSLRYPDAAMADLTDLYTLYIDGLADQKFGSGFGKLKGLRKLIMSGNIQDPDTTAGSLNYLHSSDMAGRGVRPVGQGRWERSGQHHLVTAGNPDGLCDLGVVTSETFKYVSPIHVLNISHCQIKGRMIDDDAFKPLKNLTTLDISYNSDLGFDKLIKLLTSTNSSTLTKLWVNLVTSRYSTGHNVTTMMAKSLPRSLKYLAASQNSFEYIDPDALQYFPTMLKEIDVSDNRFIFGDYMNELKHLGNLHILDVNGPNTTVSIPSHYPLSIRNLGIFRGQNKSDQSYGLSSKEVVIELPPKLKKISMGYSGLRYVLSALGVGNNSLDHVYLVNNFFPDAIGPIKGLHKLILLDLGSCGIENIESQFLGSFPHLMILLLSNNRLGYCLAEQIDSPIFQNLTKLTTLDLNENRLQNLNRNTFSGLDNLRNLSLRSNEFREFNVTIDHMTKLTYLDLSHTQLYGLPQDVRDHIDSLKARVSVNMSMTPIQCNCDNLEFIRWIAHSPAIIPAPGHYKCVVPNQYERYITDGYKETLHDLERKCKDYYFLFLSVVAGTLLVLCVILVGIVYRFRWKLRYYYYLAYLRVKGKKESESNDDFLYDVYLCYSTADEAFVVDELQTELSARGLRVFEKGRDFQAGDLMVRTILRGIRESRRTLVVLTRNMLLSKWCNYELQMAKMEAIYTGRPVLVFLLKEALTASDLGVELLYHIRNSRYISYPRADELLTSGARDQMQDVLTTFWDKLARDIRR